MTDTTQAHPQPLIENNSASQLEVGDFTVDTDARTVRGLLMPWDSLSDIRHTNAPIAFVPGAVKPPADVSIVTANINHDRYRPVGRAVSVEVGERGLFATFSIARTPEGDEFLEDHRSGKRSLSKLSPELTAITRDPSDRKRGISAVLTGAAFTSQGAFAEAGLFSLDADDEETVADLLEARIAELEAQMAALTPKSPEDDESEDNPTPSPEHTEEEAVMSTVANTEVTEQKDTDLNGLFSLVREYKNAGFNESARREVEQGLFALADVHYDKTGTGNNSLGAPIRQPAFVGELWQGRSFARKVIPLINHGQLKAMSNTGYKFTQKPTVALWSGNKSEIPTSTGKIETYTYQAKRFAGGWDIAREYIDFNEMDVIEAFLRQAVNSYAEVTDAQALTDLIAASTNLVAGAPASGISEVMHKIVKGALGVINAGGTPSAAVVAPALYEQLIFTKEVDRLAFLNASLGLEEGSVESFRVVPHTGLTAGTALVLDRNAATAEELSETPIRVSAIDLARGGFDEALHGYYATRVDMSSAIVRVTTA